MYELHVFDRHQTLAPSLRDRILAAIRSGLDHGLVRHPAPPFDVLVVPTDIHDGPGFCAARALGPHCIEVTLTPDHPRFDARCDTDLVLLAVHEFHHVLRWPHVPRWTVGELLVLEGLALAAERTHPLFDASSQPAQADEREVERALAGRSESDPARRDWLYQPDLEGAPLLYRLGDVLVTAAMVRMGADAFELVDAAAENILHQAATHLCVRLPPAQCAAVAAGPLVV